MLVTFNQPRFRQRQAVVLVTPKSAMNAVRDLSSGVSPGRSTIRIFAFCSIVKPQKKDDPAKGRIVVS
jgi:hypothetical protein